MTEESGQTSGDYDEPGAAGVTGCQGWNGTNSADSLQGAGTKAQLFTGAVKQGEPKFRCR